MCVYERVECVVLCVILAFLPHVPLLHLLSLAECFCTTCRCATRHGGEFFLSLPFTMGQQKKKMTFDIIDQHVREPNVLVPSLVFCVPNTFGFFPGHDVCFSYVKVIL